RNQCVHQCERNLNAETALLQACVFDGPCLCRSQILENLRVHTTCNIQIHILETANGNHSGDEIRIVGKINEWAFICSLADRKVSRNLDVTAGLNVGPIDDGEIVPY